MVESRQPNTFAKYSRRLGGLTDIHCENPIQVQCSIPSNSTFYSQSPPYALTKNSQHKLSMPSYPYSKHEIIGFEETLPPYHKQNDSSLRIISTQIRRIRGTCTYLSKNMNCPVLYEIYGRCVSKSEPFSNIPGLSFVLQENGHKQTVNCALYDFDEILPNIMVGNTYRCVGRYHCQKYVFQCFNVEELSENEVDLMESFQYQSNLELTELTRPNKSTKTSSRVSKTIWRPNSIANASTINHPLEFRHLTVPTAKYAVRKK